MCLKELEKLLDQFEKELNKTILNKSYLGKIGKDIKKVIQARTEAGYGVSNGNLKRYKSLKQKTIERRSSLKKRGKLSSRTSPSESNQIESGTFVEGIDYQVKGNSVEISPPKNREKMAEGQERIGRTTFDLTDKELDKIAKDIEKQIDNAIDKLF